MLTTATRSLEHLGTFMRTAATSLESLSWHAEGCHRSPEIREEAQTEQVPFSIEYEEMKMMQTLTFSLPRKNTTLRAIQTKAYDQFWAHYKGTDIAPHGSPSDAFFISQRTGKLLETDEQLQALEPVPERLGKAVSVALMVLFETPHRGRESYR